MRSICVFCSSSDELDPVYYKAAEELGEAIAITGTELIYGGGMIGLMGVLAKSAQKHNGKVTGIIPKSLARKGIMYEHAEEMIETKDLRDRKELMEKRAVAFIALPGGFGTLEELAEIITAKQLHYHKKPVVLINTNNFFHDLLNLFDRCFKEKFINKESQKLYYVAKTPKEAIEYLNACI